MFSLVSRKFLASVILLYTVYLLFICRKNCCDIRNCPWLFRTGIVWKCPVSFFVLLLCSHEIGVYKCPRNKKYTTVRNYLTWKKIKTNVISNYRIGVNIHASFSTSLFDVKFPITTLSKKSESWIENKWCNNSLD